MTERITVGLLASVAAQLHKLAEQTGMSKTDLINRSITLYAFVDQRSADGDRLLIQSASTGEIERITLL